MRAKKVLAALLCCAMTVTSIPVSHSRAKEADFSAQPPLTLWYDEPANDWESEALPLGNGFMGAMVFGGVEKDQILINEHTLWSGGPGADENYDGGHSSKTTEENVANLKRARELLQEAMTDFTENHSAYIDPISGQVISGNYEISSEVRSLIDSLKGDKSHFGSYQQLSNIMIADAENMKVLPIAIDSNSANKNSENTQYQEGPEKAFDGDNNTKWFSLGGLSGGAVQEIPIWVTVEYANPLTTSEYAIVSGNDVPGRDPKNWTLYGSNDGETFEIVDTRENVTFESRKQTKKFALDKEVSYKYYKFEVTKLNGEKGVQMQELILNVPKESSSDYTNYKRALDIDNAVASVDYTANGVNYHREYFVNNPDNVMAVRLTADKSGSISKFISIETPQRKRQSLPKVIRLQ